jgi:hypothetical protein
MTADAKSPPANGASKLGHFFSRVQIRSVLIWSLTVLACVLAPVFVHDQVQESKAFQDISTGNYCTARLDAHGIWVPFFTPGTAEVRNAIKLWTITRPTDCLGPIKQAPSDLAQPSNSSLIFLAVVVSSSLLALSWALVWNRHPGYLWRTRFILLSVLLSAAVGASIYLYFRTLGFSSPLDDADARYTAFAVAIGTSLFVGILKLDFQNLSWPRISAGFFALAGVLLFANYRLAQHKAAELSAQGILLGGDYAPVTAQITPGFTIASSSRSNLRRAPSYYFRLSTSSDHATSGDTFPAFAQMFYDHGDFASDQRVVEALNSPESIIVPPCAYRVSATLTSPTFRTPHPVIDNVVSVSPGQSASAKWLWLVVAYPTGKQDLQLTPNVTVVGGNEKSCRSNQSFSLTPIVTQVQVLSGSGGFVADASVITNLLAAISALLGVLSAIVGLTKRGQGSAAPAVAD